LIGENITLVVAPAGAAGCVMADPAQIGQVVMNLAVNARDAMLDGGTLTIETRNVELDEAPSVEHASAQRGPHVMLSISDTGAGMDEATRDRIFEPFFTTKDFGQGTGLGLSTVYGIVEQSGGTIEVDSEPGKGTTFRICLPRVENAASRTPSATAPSRPGTETILVVEDEPGVRRLAERILQMAGYTVLKVGSGEEALSLMERHSGPVDLVLTDVVLPGISGRELAERLAGLRPRMKVLYTSGYTDDAILRHGVLDEALHFIGKPYGAAALTRKVREVLDLATSP
jgi:CheY-like chemotaxis protein